jgi:hypothetical protein
VELKRSEAQGWAIVRRKYHISIAAIFMMFETVT